MNRKNFIVRDYVKELNEIIRFQLETNNIIPKFSPDIENLRREDFKEEPCKHRECFIDYKTLTIDSIDSKDMDDAVNIIKTSDGFILMVHIADVANYVSIGSNLDKEAITRATSIYLPNLTVPMLPPVLSNDLCSLNPGVERKTLSVIINLDKNGNVIDSTITKGIIKSRVKGVYSEINQLLEGSNESELLHKYSEVYDEIFEMAELYKLLRNERISRGANVEDSNKPKITVHQNSIDLEPSVEGVAENMIEEFMILANSIVAEYLYNNNLPAIFRIQEEKNHLAAYRPVREHHADLCLENYSHFTSPIRRVADLKIHQVLTLHLNGVSHEIIHKLFDYSLWDVCDRATKRSRTAKSVQDYCERYCYRQYFNTHSQTRFTGTFVGYDRRQRPVMRVEDYNIMVIGYAVIGGSIGEQYTFNVNVSNDKDMVTTKVHRVFI